MANSLLLSQYKITVIAMREAVTYSSLSKWYFRVLVKYSHRVLVNPERGIKCLALIKQFLLIFSSSPPFLINNKTYKIELLSIT